MKNPLARTNQRTKHPVLHDFEPPAQKLKRRQVKILRQWTAHLRANPDKQGHGRLTTIFDNDPSNDLHCCLGVLCEMAVAAGVVERDVQIHPDLGYDSVCVSYGPPGEDKEAAILPTAVRLWAGLPYSSGLSTSPESLITIDSTLPYLNDGDGEVKGHPFGYIADAIDGWIGQNTKS
jgi:hypothetical protein